MRKSHRGSRERHQGMERGTLRWSGILLALLLGCGLATYYVHVYGETDEGDEENSVTSQLIVRKDVARPVLTPAIVTQRVAEQ